jgi:hypothetical protein
MSRVSAQQHPVSAPLAHCLRLSSYGHRTRLPLGMTVGDRLFDPTAEEDYPARLIDFVGNAPIQCLVDAGGALRGAAWPRVPLSARYRLTANTVMGAPRRTR